MAIVQSAGTLAGLNRAPWGWSSSTAGPGLVSYGGKSFSYAELYRTQPNVRLVCRFLGRNIAQLPLHGYRRRSVTDRERLVPPHPLAEVLRRPNPRTTRHRFVRALVEDVAVFDEAFTLKVRNEANGRLNLFRLPPQYLEPVGDSWLFADAWRVRGSEGDRVYSADQVIHIHGHSLDDPRRGCSALEALRRTLAEETAAGEWREQFWQRSARMSGVIQRPADAPRWSDTARARFEDDWMASMRGDGGRAGETPILEDGMTYSTAAFSPEEAEYLGARKLTREEVAAAYFIPPAFVGILENANFSNMAEQHISLYADTLGPWLDLLTEDLELQLLPDLADSEECYVEFGLEEKLRGSFEAQAAASSTAVGAPWVTRNEVRARNNLPPIDGGDELIVPLNVLEGGLASPRDTAPPPESAAPGDTPTGGAAGRPPAGAKRVTPAARARSIETHRHVRKWDEAHRRVIGAFLRRQESKVLAGLGAGRTVDEAFDGTDPGRWNRELGADLLKVAVAMNADVGGLVAGRYGTEYDANRAAAWLRKNAQIAADNVNATTRSALAEAVHGAPLKARGAKATGTLDDVTLDDWDTYELDLEDDEPLDSGLPDPLEGARGVFAYALGARLAQVALSRSTSVGNFSLADGAGQAGALHKVWIVTSAQSRHPDLDGESVPLGHDFSNGAAWPGDPILGVDEVAGCTCVLDFA